MFNPNSKLTALISLGLLNCMTGPDAEGIGSNAPTVEQLQAAQALDQNVQNLENQEALSIFAQSRAFRELRDTEAYKLLQSKDGTNFVSFGQYVTERTSKSIPTVSQNITTVTTFNDYEDEELAKAGREKLYVASLMIGTGAGKPFPTAKEALQAAQTKTRVELQAMRTQGEVAKQPTVYLAPLKVTLGQQERFMGGYEKYERVWATVHGREGSTMEVTDFYNDVVSGLPIEFLTEAAQGQGGAAPQMEGGFTPMDVPVEEVLHFLAVNLQEAGRDPMEIISSFEVTVESLKERHAIEENERREREKAEQKDAKTRDANNAKWSKRLSKVRQFQTIDFSDGAKVSVVESESNPDTNEFKGLWLKGVQDGSENTFPEDNTFFTVDKIVAFGIVGVNAAPKAEKKAAAVAQAEGSDKPKRGKKAVEEAAPSIGISKAQQAGGKKGKAKKPDAISEGTVAPE